MRYSRQREEILYTVQNSNEHLSAENIYEILKKKMPNISLGTVYRNLNVLYNMGLMKKIPIYNNPDRFDKTITQHYHLICNECNNIYDISSNILNKLKDNLSNETGYIIKDCDMTFYGICHKCKERK